MTFRCGVLLLVLAIALGAQPPLTTMADTVYAADGSPFVGTLQIHSSNFTTSGGAVVTTSKLVRFPASANGAFSVQLAPTDTAVPPGAYYQFVFSNGAQWTCTIPTSSAPIKFGAPNCAPGTFPAASVNAGIALLSLPSPPASGVFCVEAINGTINYAWVPCASLVTVPTLSLSALTLSQLQSLTLYQLQTMTP